MRDFAPGFLDASAQRDGIGRGKCRKISDSCGYPNLARVRTDLIRAKCRPHRRSGEPRIDRLGGAAAKPPARLFPNVLTSAKNVGDATSKNLRTDVSRN
jgi:hypothetical protein